MFSNHVLALKYLEISLWLTLNEPPKVFADIKCVHITGNILFHLWNLFSLCYSCCFIFKTADWSLRGRVHSLCVSIIVHYGVAIWFWWLWHLNDVHSRFPRWFLFIATVVCSVLTTADHSWHFCLHHTVACLYLALPKEHYLLFTRGFTHRNKRSLSRDTDPGFCPPPLPLVR